MINDDNRDKAVSSNQTLNQGNATVGNATGPAWNNTKGLFAMLETMVNEREKQRLGKYD
jgi:hypothetical protein